jgi:hypothetical protein
MKTDPKTRCLAPEYIESIGLTTPCALDSFRLISRFSCDERLRDFGASLLAVFVLQVKEVCTRGISDGIEDTEDL